MGYMSAHNRVRRINGKAVEYRCEHCDMPALEWALDHGMPNLVTESDRFGRYSNNPDDYIPLCKPCHNNFDKAPITHCPKGHPYSGDNLIIDTRKRKCRTCVYARNRERQQRTEITQEQRNRKNELQRIRRAKQKEATA